MTLQIYEWNSYCCNNSSDHRLIATFESATRAKAMADELSELFLKHAQQSEEAEDGDADWDPDDLDPSPALVEFATKYGGEFVEGLSWGDEGNSSEDLPEVAVLENTLFLYHGYSGGFGQLDDILEKAGATEVETNDGAPWLKFTAKADGTDSVVALHAAVAKVLDQRETLGNLCDWEAPWSLPIETDLDKVTFVPSDQGLIFTLAMGADAIEGCKEFLQKNGAHEVSISLATDSDIASLQTQEAAHRDAALENNTDAELFDPSGLSFLFTGKLAAMNRTQAQARVEDLGGVNAKSVNKSLNVLVIGDDGSPLFGAGTKGSKHVKAEKLIDAGADLRIISESHFLQLKKAVNDE